MRAFLLRFSFLTLSTRRLPLWQYTMQVRLSETVRKNDFLNLLFLTIFGFAASHTGQRGTPPGERGREKENRSKNRHFPPPSPLTVFLSGLSFPSPPIPHPLPVFAFVKTSRLNGAIARVAWMSAAIFSSIAASDTDNYELRIINYELKRSCPSPHCHISTIRLLTSPPHKSTVCRCVCC